MQAGSAVHIVRQGRNSKVQRRKRQGRQAGVQNHADGDESLFERFVRFTPFTE